MLYDDESDAPGPIQGTLFKVMLRDIVNPGHELILLRDAIDWDRCFPTMSRWRSRVGETGVT